MNQFPPKCQRVITDAIAKGYTVRIQEGKCNINKGKTTRSVGIVIYVDGTCFRNDIDLTLTVPIKTEKNMREALSL